MFEAFYAETPQEPTDRQKVEMGHDSLNPDRLTGQIEALVKLRQPVHVGSGMIVPPRELGLESSYPLVKAFFRSDKHLRIPGTSLKGAIRSLVEMYTASCAPASGDRDSCRYKDERSPLCLACRIFGAMGYQGRLHFEDGRFGRGKWQSAVKDVPPQYGSKPHAGMRRYYPHALVETREAKWPLEVVGPGVRFQIKGAFNNLSYGELGVVLIALGQGRWHLCPKIGAAKNSGLGAVEVTQLTVTALEVRAAYQSMAAQASPVDVARCLAEAEPLIDTVMLQRLQEDLGCQKLEEA
jgi:CRISPR/Cas system CSM-associated protein Csm3 (group 7 of RAMP superfamily)